MEKDFFNYAAACIDANKGSTDPNTINESKDSGVDKNVPLKSRIYFDATGRRRKHRVLRLAPTRDEKDESEHYGDTSCDSSDSSSDNSYSSSSDTSSNSDSEGDDTPAAPSSHPSFIHRRGRRLPHPRPL